MKGRTAFGKETISAAGLALALSFAALNGVSCGSPRALPDPEPGTIRLAVGQIVALGLDPATGALVRVGPSFMPAEAPTRAAAGPAESELPAPAVTFRAAALSLASRGVDRSSLYLAVEGKGLARIQVAADGSLAVAGKAEDDPAFAGRSVMGWVRVGGDSFCVLYAMPVAPDSAAPESGGEIVGRDEEGRPLDASFLRFDRAFGKGWQIFAAFDAVDGMYAQLRKEGPERAEHKWLFAPGAPPFKPESLEREDFQARLYPRLLSVAPRFVRDAMEALRPKANVLVETRGDRGTEIWISRSLDEDFEPVYAFVDGDSIWAMASDGMVILPSLERRSLPLPAEGARYAEFAVVNGVLVARWTLDRFPETLASGVVLWRFDQPSR
jgi:hypothetical protein